MAVNYKILFEVKLLHEFFLTRQDGSTIFDLPNQDQRLNFLLEEFSKGNESINSALSYEFHESTKKEYEGYGLKLLPGYSGFKVAARINAKKLNDNSLVFEPYFPLPDNYCINVLVKRKDRSLDGYTNGAVHGSLPSFYFFSTGETTGDKIFPFLTHAVSGFDAARKYEQGELASFGANDVRAFYRNTAGDQWDSISTGSFANENDRLLLRTRFNYFFPESSTITSSEFILKDGDGNIVQSAVFSTTERMSKVTVDFSSKRDSLNMRETLHLEKKIFSLEVSGNNGYSHLHRVLFSDRLYDENPWALISIRSKPVNSDFRLIADDGYLIKRKDPLGIWVNAPVFEVPVKSRFNYWRFINNRGRKLELAPELQDYLDLEEGVLLTKRPRSSARNFFLLRKAGSSDTKYVPNPVNYSLRKDNKERICFDVIVPESTLFHPVP